MNKNNKVLKIIGYTAITILIPAIIVIVVDNFFEGSFANWFVSRFMYDVSKDTSIFGYPDVEGKLNWQLLKNFIINLTFISAGMISIIIAFAIFATRKKTTEQQNVSIVDRLSQWLKGTIEHESDKEYSPIDSFIKEIDIREKQSKQLMELEMNKRNDLITYLAHDLKTPLTSVIGYVSFLNETPELANSLREKYQKIALEKAYKLEKLINEFFDITRFNFQDIPMENEHIDFYYMMVQMTDEFYPLLKDKSLSTKINADENMCIYGDPLMLARVFNNIFKNAIAYCYPSTTIEIIGQTHKDYSLIAIRDQGKIIPSQNLKNIFNKFYRIDKSRNSTTGGTGLGLAIAKEIIVQHNGSIEAESDEASTSFIIKLPLGTKKHESL